MEIEGTVVKEISVREDISMSGTLCMVATYLVETLERHPCSMVVTVCDDAVCRVVSMGFAKGKRMKFYFHTSAIEDGNGCWHNNIGVYDAREIDEQQPAVAVAKKVKSRKTKQNKR